MLILSFSRHHTGLTRAHATLPRVGLSVTSLLADSVLAALWTSHVAVIVVATSASVAHRRQRIEAWHDQAQLGKGSGWLSQPLQLSHCLHHTMLLLCSICPPSGVGAAGLVVGSQSLTTLSGYHLVSMIRNLDEDFDM